MNLKQWLWLFLIQAVWTASYAAMKIAVRDMPISVVVFLRFGIASVCVVGYWLLRRRFPRFSWRDLGIIVAVGFADFAISPILQVASLTYTQAIDVSILIAFEPMLTVLAATLLLRERPKRATVIALSAATFGMLILSGVSFSGMNAFTKIRLFGNLLFLTALVFEAIMTVAGRTLTQRYRPIDLTGSMFIAGFLGVTLINFPTIAATHYGEIGPAAWASVLFLGLGCSIFGYTAWYGVIRTIPANRIALSLFLQPILGTFIGWYVLNESIAVETFAGAALICASLAWWQHRLAKLERR